MSPKHSTKTPVPSMSGGLCVSGGGKSRYDDGKSRPLLKDQYQLLFCQKAQAPQGVPYLDEM